MPPDNRGSERTMHITMKAARSAPPIAHPNGHPASFHGRAASRSAAPPLSSPLMVVHSVGQAYPPKLSPQSPRSTAPRAGQQDSSSPSYFGLVVEQATNPRDSAAAPRDNWSPPSSSVKSFTAAMQTPFMPLDANPAFDAFRSQAEANHLGRMFALGGSTKNTPGTPQPQGIVDSKSPSASRILALKPLAPSSPMQIDTNVVSTTTVQKEASVDSFFFPNVPRHESPAQIESVDETRSALSPIEDRHPRLSLTMGRPCLPPPMRGIARADTAPIETKDDTGMMDVAQLRNILDTAGTAGPKSLLLLDVRVSTYYGTSRIQGALNLCIPTTLLKRSTYNLQKLQHTFARDEDQAKFANWRDTQFLVVYDSSSTEKRDATAAMNMLRKFTAEGYQGKARVLRGGFKAFEAACPQLVDRQQSAYCAIDGRPGLSLSGDRKGLSIAPIIGGVVLPSASATPVPFFSNIRQNMDLADGVGRMHVSVPASLDTTMLPLWLREAVDPVDAGHRVSDRFLRIEQAEQTRMKSAYSAFNSTCIPGVCGKVQLSGIEKGVKNRYKDILPFEHSRVHLHGRPKGACDYVNASHIRAGRSLKRYIASQGPLPATFEDFWSVVWDQDVRVIVMLTAESEGGQLKCHPYWTGREYGPIKLRLLSERKVSLDMNKYRANSAFAGAAEGLNTAGEDAAAAGRRRASTMAYAGSSPATSSMGAARPGMPPAGVSSQTEPAFVVVRKFSLTHSSCPFDPIREVTQLHYSSWPDFGAPAKPSDLLALIELANAMQSTAPPMGGGSIDTSKGSNFLSTWLDEPEHDADVRPMLVHCSAGCGRTGTFCTVDSVIDMLKRRRQVAERHAAHTATDGDLCWLDKDSVDLVAKTVEDFRTQRLSMVQSLRQFVLCYETVAEWFSKAQERQGIRFRGSGRARSESVRMQG